MKDLTIQQYQDLLIAARNRGDNLDSLKTKLANNGFTIGGVPMRAPSMASAQNIQEATQKYDLLGPTSRNIGDVLPGLAAGFAGGINPTAIVRKGASGALLRAAARIGMSGAAGGAGELVRENVYRGGGEQAPPSPAAAMFGQMGVPGQALQEAAAQATMQGIAEPVGYLVKGAGKLLMRLPGSNLKMDVGQEALDQNLPLNIGTGVKKLKERYQPLLAKQANLMNRYDQSLIYDVHGDVIGPVLNEVSAMADATNFPDEAKSALGDIVGRWLGQGANQGSTLAPGVPNQYMKPSRLLQLLTDAQAQPGVIREYTNKELGAMTPRAAGVAKIQAQFYKKMSENIHGIIKKDMPELVDIRSSMARNQALQSAIRRNQTGKIPSIVMRHAGALVGGGAVAAIEPAENNQERLKHMIGWAAMTEAMSNPRGINFLAELLRQSPRLANTIGTMAAPDATSQP
jgi:hypothetical protein